MKTRIYRLLRVSVSGLSGGAPPPSRLAALRTWARVRRPGSRSPAVAQIVRTS